MAAFSSGQFLGIVLLCLAQQLTTINAVTTRSAVIKRLLSHDDLRAFRPNNDQESEPTKVVINFFVRDLYVLDDSMQYIGAQLTFRQEWNDPRLAYPETDLTYLNLPDPKAVWTPDIFFSNSREGRINNIMEPNLLLRVYPSGDVVYSTRVTLDFKCKTDTRLFPLNKLECPIILASYGLTTKDLVLEWKETKPVQMSKTLVLPSYTISFEGTERCDSKTITGEYACLKAIFVLEHRSNAVFSLLYMPPMFLVLLGWLSFFLQRRNGKVRLSLLLTILVLGCLSCANSAWQNPNRLALTASDMWSGLCLTFVTYALLHFIMTRHVPCLARVCGYDEEKARPGHVEAQPMITGEGLEKGEGGKSKIGKTLQVTTARIRHLVTHKGNKADVIARMLYPTAFIIVNIIYWAAYKQQEEQF